MADKENRKFSLVAQPNSIPYSDEYGNFDISWLEKFGATTNVTLLSITTAPSGTFEIGSQYYNSTDKLIYTAVQANTWTDATTEQPKFGAIYSYNSLYYIWDGDNLVESDLEKYQLISNITQDPTETSATKYPSSAAMLSAINSILPNRAGHDGQFLSTNNSILSWEDVSSSLFFSNKTASSWVSDSTYSGYSYKCEISCIGVTSNMYPIVNFSYTDSISGNYCHISETDTDKVIIWSKVQTTITIPTIVVIS